MAALKLDKLMDHPVEANRKIFFTNNYGMFGWIPGNRLLDERRIKKICHANTVDGINLFPYVPILVTKDYKIIDGQHRLMAAKRLKCAIYFVYVEDYDISKVALINSVTKTWGIKDYMNCWINLGKKDYIELEKFMKQYSVPVTTASSLLMYGKITKGGDGGIKDPFRTGNFKVNHLKYAISVADKYKQYIEISDFNKSSYLVRAVLMLDKSEKYNHDQVIQKLTTTGARLEPKGSAMEFISHIELLYNKGNQKRRVIY